MRKIRNRKIRNKIGKIVVIPLSILAVFLWLCILLIELPGYNLFVVIGNSMTPTLNHGDLGINKTPRTIKCIRVGDIISYDIEQLGGTIHRVIKIDVEKNIIRTKGDANCYVDPWIVRFEDVKGIYLFHVPYLGHILIAAVEVRASLLLLFIEHSAKITDQQHN